MSYSLSSVPSFVSRLLRAAKEDVEPIASRQILVHLAETLPSSSFFRVRTAMLRAAGVKIGEHSLVQGKVRLTGNGNPCELLSIGEHTLVTGGLHVDLGAPIRIGNWVRIGHDVSLLTINHAVGPHYLRAGVSFFGEIVIEDGCWLASRCTVLPGVSIGAGAIVAAGSVVTRNVPKHTLVAGVPARVVRELGEDAEPQPLSVRYDSTPPAAR
jgi:acetyltransferase-like isoleucine patch superfamily enzyme